MATSAAPTTATPDNNIAATQAGNASFAATNPGVFGASSSPTSPANTNTITSSQLQPNPQISLPPPVTSPDTTSGIVGGATQTSKSVSDYVNELTPTSTTPADQEQQTILDQIANLTAQDTGKDQALVAAQQASGATQDQADLTNLNNQLLTQTASYNNQFANLGGNNGVETSAVLNAQTAGLKKAQAADIGLTTAQIQAKQGNLTLAMNTAQAAVNAKYSTIEDNIKTAQAQLAAIQPMLTQEDKTTALAQQQVLKDQADAVAAQKDKETQINNVALQAATAGATPDVIAAINNSPDVVSAIAAAAPALGAKVANDLKQQAFDNSIKLRTAANDATRLAIEAQAPINNIALEAAKNGADAATIQAITSSKDFASALSVAAPSLGAATATVLKTVANATVTTTGGKTYVDGTGMDAATKNAATANGQIVLTGQPLQAAQTIDNTQQQLGTLLSALQQNGVNLTQTTTGPGGTFNQGSTSGFLQTWAAGNATPALRTFATALTGTNKTGTDGLIAQLEKLPGTGSLVATLQNNLPSDKDSANVLNTKLTNIKNALDTTQNSLLVDNSQPTQIQLNGKTLTLQADGTYQ